MAEGDDAASKSEEATPRRIEEARKDGDVPKSAELAQVCALAGAFALGIQLTAPVLAFSLIFNVATGLVGRAMPQFQIFFAAAPLQILLGLSLFALSFGVMGTYWLDRFRDVLQRFG